MAENLFCEVTVTLKLIFEPNLKKFPKGVPEIMRPRKWTGRMDVLTTRKHNASGPDGRRQSSDLLHTWRVSCWGCRDVKV